MTTGALIYLVSACGSGEEFIAAFRRYADRNGLFVPIADPIPAGRRGRFAVALRDGGVMVEGQAEVVSSARTPSVLHGRVGMTLRFVVPDEPSKIVLDELVKARLAMKPPPSSVAPRPAELPPAPRPVPPAPGGRIDAASALAECVAIGDLGALQVVEGAVPPKAGPKFVVPSIPPVGKAAPTPPAALPRVAKLEDLPPPPEAFEGPKTEAMSAIDPEPAPSTATPTSISVPAVPLPTATPISIPVPAPLPTPTPLSIPVPAPLPSPQPAAAKPAKRPSGQLPGMPPAPASPPAPTSPPTRPSAPLFAPPPPPLVERPSSFDIAPLPPPPTGPMQVPQVPVPGAPPDALADGEPTDVAAPIPAVAGATAAAKDATPRPPVIGVPPPPRPPVVEEPTPSGDWTMVPGADGPTIQPRVPKPRPESSPTGNWSISLDPQSEGGWSPPAKIAPTPSPAGRARSEPMPVVSSTQPLESEPRRPVADLAAISEPKVQVDPTLIEPLIPLSEAMPSPVRSSGSQPSMEAPMAASSSNGMRLQHLLTPVPGFAPPYVPPAAPAQAGPFPPSANGAVPVPLSHYPSDAVASVPPSRRTQIIIVVASAFLVLAAAVTVFVVISGGRGHSGEAAPPAATPPPPSAPPPAAGATAPERAADRAAVDRAAVSPAPADTAPAAGSAAAGSNAAGPAAASPCSFEVASAPPGAEIVGESGEVIATTPGKLSLPCDVEVKLTFRKARYLPLERKYTPTSDAKPLKVALAKLTLSLKVSSTPPGATVTIGGKPQGVTPTTVRVPANELSTLTLTKEGFATEVQKITPNKNNQAVQVTLKRTSPVPPRKAPR